MNLDTISDNLDQPWDWETISINKHTTWDFVEKNITMDIVNNNPHKPWRFYTLGENPNLTQETVLLYPNENRNWLRRHFIHPESKNVSTLDMIQMIFKNKI